MDLLNSFVRTYLHYAHEIIFMLAVGFLISGLFYKFVPSDWVSRHLGEKGMKAIVLSSIVGIILPVCCIGSLPIALTLKKKGANLGSVLAFLVATPATSVPALMVCWKLLGLRFTVAIFFAVSVLAIVMGVVINSLRIPPKELRLEENDQVSNKDCCTMNKSGLGGSCPSADPKRASLFEDIKGALYYAFVTLPQTLWLEVLIGIGMASFIAVFEPLQELIRNYLTGFIGFFVIIIVGLLTYVCSTASVPMADALIQSGMTQGQALCYLLAGPVTSYGTMLVIKKDFGLKILMVYLGVIISVSLVAGLMFDVVMKSTG